MKTLFVNEEYDQKEDEELSNRKILSSLNKGEIKTSFGSFSC